MLDQQDGLGVGPLRAVALLALVAAPAGAATHDYAVSSFDRLRVDGPFEVRVETGPPNARAEADEALLDRVSVEQQGETLIVRLTGARTGARVEAPAVVKLSTPALRSVAVNAGGRVALARLTGQQVNVSVNGAGAISVAAADADQLTATVIGAGSVTLTGQAGRARLLTNGPGTIDASALVANELTVRLDGTGETRAAARYTAQVTNTGLGRVSVTGDVKCSIIAPAGGPVECGPKL